MMHGRPFKEQKIYQKALGNELRVVLGVPTLARQRNFITSYFKEGSHVLSLDDDLEGLYCLKGGQLSALAPGSLLAICRDAKARMAKAKAFLWSLNAPWIPFWSAYSLRLSPDKNDLRGALGSSIQRLGRTNDVDYVDRPLDPEARLKL